MPGFIAVSICLALVNSEVGVVVGAVAPGAKEAAWVVGKDIPGGGSQVEVGDKNHKV